MTDVLPLAFRGPTEADVSFIFKSWLMSMRGAPAYAAQTSAIYFPRAHSVVEALWYDPKVAWVVAVDPEFTDHIHGFLCGQRAKFVAGQDHPIIHFLYVRHVSRRWRVATRLVECFDTRPPDARKAPIRISTLSPKARDILRTRPGQFILDPWMLWEYARPGRKRSVEKAMEEARAQSRALARAKADDFQLGWRDPNPKVASGALEDDGDDFAAEFEAMARAARRGGGVDFTGGGEGSSK